MEILNGQKILTARLDPFLFSQCLAFGAVPVPAGVIRYFQVAAFVALILMAAKGSGPAYLDGAHDPQMITGQLMGFSIRKAVLTEDVRHLGAVRCSHPLSSIRIAKSIEGTCDLRQVQTADMQIDGGRCGRPVAQKQLDMVEARSSFNKMRSKGMP